MYVVFFKQKTAYDRRISDWSSDVCSSDLKIITVEDPVEYQIEGINPIQAKPQIGLDFANALRSIVRQDPDLIMIGEMRDLATARIAIHSSSDERRVGKECASTCSSRCSPCHKKKKIPTHHPDHITH